MATSATSPEARPLKLSWHSGWYKGQNLGPTPTWTDRFLQLEQFVLFLPEERVLLGVIRLVERLRSPLSLGDIPTHKLPARAPCDVLANIINPSAFVIALHVGKKRNLLQPHICRTGCDVHEDTFWVAPDSMPLSLDQHFRPKPNSPAYYLFAALVPHLLFDRIEAFANFCTRNGLVDYVARFYAGQEFITEAPCLSVSDIRYPNRAPI